MEVIIHKHIEIEELRKIVPTWEELEENFDEVTIFQEINWLINWWYKEKKFKKITPYIIEIKDKNETIGIIPLYLSEKEFSNLQFRILRPIGIVDSNYLLPILSKNYSSRALLNKAMDAIYKDRNSWDCIHWGDVPEGSAFDLFLKEQMNDISKKQIYRKETSISPQIILSKDMEDVKNKASKKFIKGLLRLERKLMREGDLQYHRVIREEEIEPIMDKHLEFHKERWKLTDTPSVYNESPAAKKFLMEIVRSFFRNDLLHLSYLTHNGEIAAIEFGVITNKTRYLLMGTMNPNYHQYSIGHIIVYKLVEEACAEGYEIIDFFRGNEEYKQKWRPKNIVNLEYMFFNSSVRSSLFKVINNTYYSKQFQQASLIKQLPFKSAIRGCTFLLGMNNKFKRRFDTKVT